MVNWAHQAKQAEAKALREYGVERLRWNRYLERLTKQQEADLMASKKRTPLVWDGKKKLPWPIHIYYAGRRFTDIVDYDLAKGFRYRVANGALVSVGTGTKSFLVQRLH